jgi:hypothetical protein
MVGSMSHRKKTLGSVRAVVDALGGTTAVTDLLDVGPTAVWNWLSLNVIPPRWFFAIDDALGALGYEADRALFRELPRTARTANAD